MPIRQFKAVETAAYKNFEELINGKIASIDKSIANKKLDKEKGEAKKAKFQKRIAPYKDVVKRLKRADFDSKETVFAADGGEVFSFKIKGQPQKAVMDLFPEGKFKAHSVRKTLETTIKIKGVLVLIKVITLNGEVSLSGSFSDYTYDADPVYEAEKRLRRHTG